MRRSPGSIPIFWPRRRGMRASARATWSMIKGSIEGIEEEVRRMKEQSEAEAAGAKR
jgi:hypothetical protein